MHKGMAKSRQSKEEEKRRRSRNEVRTCGLMDKACALSLPVSSAQKARVRRGAKVAALDGAVARNKPEEAENRSRTDRRSEQLTKSTTFFLASGAKANFGKHVGRGYCEMRGRVCTKSRRRRMRRRGSRGRRRRTGRR